MTYESTLTIKHESKWEPTSFSNFDDFIPEEHIVMTYPSADLTTKQYFKIFRNFLLSIGMCDKSIATGALDLVFSSEGWLSLETQRGLAKDFELILEEDFLGRYKAQRELDEEVELLSKYTEEQLRETNCENGV